MFFELIYQGAGSGRGRGARGDSDCGEMLLAGDQEKHVNGPRSSFVERVTKVKLSLWSCRVRTHVQFASVQIWPPQRKIPKTEKKKKKKKKERGTKTKNKNKTVVLCLPAGIALCCTRHAWGGTWAEKSKAGKPHAHTHTHTDPHPSKKKEKHNCVPSFPVFFLT